MEAAAAVVTTAGAVVVSQGMPAVLLLGRPALLLLLLWLVGWGPVLLLVLSGVAVPLRAREGEAGGDVPGVAAAAVGAGEPTAAITVPRGDAGAPGFFWAEEGCRSWRFRRLGGLPEGPSVPGMLLLLLLLLLLRLIPLGAPAPVPPPAEPLAGAGAAGDATSGDGVLEDS